jgi:putative oxidoreductase
MRDVGLLILRVFPSLLLFIFHGIPKIQKPHYGLVKMIGLPFPEIFTWASILAETLFAIFVMIGLWTRISAIILVINFLFASYLHLFILKQSILEAEKPILFLIIYLTIALIGAGKISIDKK